MRFPLFLLLPTAFAGIVSEINNSDALWTAGHNVIFENYNTSQIKSLLGADLTKDLTLPTVSWPADDAIPSDFDARTAFKGCIGPVLNQADCGSCWAFGAAEAISDRRCISETKTNGGDGASNFIQLAPLDLVACDRGFFSNHGCQGGQLGPAWSYAKSKGLVDEKCFPYGKSEGGPIPTCKPSQQPCMPNTFVSTPSCPHSCHDGSDIESHKHHVSTVYNVSSEVESIQKEIMTHGPVEAAFTVYEDFVHYKSGVYSHRTGKMMGGHAIKIIGWGSSPTPYWLVQNSWTESWGLGGYFKIAHGSCGIEDNVVAGLFTAKKNDSFVPLKVELVPPTIVSLSSNATPHYEDPNKSGSCQEGEVDIQIQGVSGKMCAPSCGLFKKCPTDKPNGVTAQPQCALQASTGGKYCALICSPSAGDAQCGENASCKAISGTGICTYDK